MAQGAIEAPDLDTQGTPGKGKPVTPTEDGEVSQTLNQLLEDRVYGGHPALGEEGEGNNGPGEGEEEGTPGEEAPAKEEPPVKDEPPKEEAPAFQPKHKSWEETEKARKEAEKLAHDRATKASDLEKENQRIKDEAEQIRQELETLKAKPKPQEAPPLDDAIDRYAKALAAANELNTFDPDYNKKVAKIMVEAGFAGHSAPDPAVLQTLIAEQVETKVKEAIKQSQAQTTKETEQARVIGRANTLAADEGLDMKEGSPDFKAFWLAAKDAPPDKSLEEQVKWAAEEVKALKSAFRQGYKQEIQTGEQHQIQNAPMERGGNRPPAQPKKEEPFSINNILDKTARRI